MLLTLLLALQSMVPSPTSGPIVVPPEFPSFRIGGRLMSDFHFAEGGAATEAAVGEEFLDGAEVRRARIRVSGDLAQDLSFLTEYDFASSGDLKEMSLRYGHGDTRWRVGYFRQPFGIDNSTSSRFHDLLEEPPMSSALATSRAAGLGWRRAKRGYTLQGGLYRSLSPSVGRSTDEAWSVNGRAVWRPWNEGGGVASDTHLLHLGLAANLAFPDAPFALEAGPGVHMAPDLVSSGSLDASELLRLALEMAWIEGAWHGTAEWMTARPELTTGGHPNFHGWSLSSGYFLTGEARGYSSRRATFDRVIPVVDWTGGGSGGAWEVVARVSQLDLTATAGPEGEMLTTAMGLNFHFNAHTRVMFDWTRADIETLDSSDFFSVRISFDW
ncbi:MAG: OprO/OprP family phosphate-selective porin [Planctomycetota bacterium]